MNACTVTDSTTRYTRISKHRARQLWGTQDLALCPAKLCPGLPWAAHYVVHVPLKRTVGWNVDYDFDYIVRSFEHGNCSHEAGYYAAFYTMEDL